MVPRIAASTAAIILLALAACHDKPTSSATTSQSDNGNRTGTAFQAFDEMDALKASLAERAAKKLGFESKDYLVIVTEAGVPPGTLLRPGDARAASWTACAPGEGISRPPVVALPDTFPSVTVNDRIAASFGLDDSAIAQIANAKVDVNSGHDVTLSFKGVKANYLADDQLEQVLAQPACKAAINGKTLYFVRGEIIGQRSLDLHRTAKAGASVGVAKVGNVAITPLDNAVDVAINDPEAVQFLQIIAVLEPPPPAPGATMPMPVPAPAPAPVIASAAVEVAKVAAKPVLPFIYVQRDVTDGSTKAADVVRALGDGGRFRVIPKVEAVPHDAMPMVAQVRYFSDADRDAADAAVQKLQALFPDAQVRKIGLKAPRGQLEVWLPKATGVAPVATPPA